jgi:replicative DNA helicase
MNNRFENEQSTLGGLLHLSDLSCESAQKVLSMLKPSSFYDPKNRAVFEAILDLEKESVNLDLMTVPNKLNQNGKRGILGDSLSYVADLYSAMPSAANIVFYADEVRQNSIKLTINNKMQSALAEFNDLNGENVYQKLGQLESIIASLGQRAVNGRESGLVHIKDIGNQWVSELQERQKDPSAYAGLTTGIESLDSVIGPKGLVKGALLVVGARPKIGKTAFLTTLSAHVAMRLKKKVNIFSLEMPNLQMYERFLSAESKVNSDKFHTVDMTEGEFGNAIETVGKFNKANIYMDDTPSITLQHIKKECRKSARGGSIGLICVDYLTLMSADKADTNSLAYGMITKGLKELAKELDCVVLLLTQLNRGLEQRADKRPMPSDSRDTGSIEQDADYWIGLYREGVYNDSLSPSQKGLTEAIMRLNRHGNVGTGYMNMQNGYLVNSVPFSFETKQELTSKKF